MLVTISRPARGPGVVGSPPWRRPTKSTAVVSSRVRNGAVRGGGLPPRTRRMAGQRSRPAPQHAASPTRPTARILNGGDLPHSQNMEAAQEEYVRHASQIRRQRHWASDNSSARSQSSPVDQPAQPEEARRRARSRLRRPDSNAVRQPPRPPLPSPPPAAGLAERAPGGLGRRAARPRGAGRGGSRSVSRGCPPCPPPPS